MSAVTPFGARGLRFAIPEGADRRGLFAALRALPGVVDVVLAEELGLVVGGDEASITGALARRGGAPDGGPRVHVVPVVYDGEDLQAIAMRLGLRAAGVVRAHTDREHVVSMLGFLPGFAYLRGVDPRLALPRRESPRARVPPGSVAIAAGYTGIYPFASPGGWHLLGRAAGFSPWTTRGAALAIGDRVRFEAVGGDAGADADADAEAGAGAGAGAGVGAGAEADAEAGASAGARARATATARPHLVVTRLTGLALLVDGGRQGHMHEGVPHGGPLVVSGLARANAALGNGPGACGVEVLGSIELTARGGRVAVADDRRGAVMLGDGASVTVASDARSRVRYVSVVDGVDVPIVLGGRGTLLVAALGGLHGRPLRRGDALAPLAERADAAVSSDALAPARDGADDAAAPDDAPITITLGPDGAPAAAVDALLAGAFRVSPASDRTGTRLDGPPLGAAGEERPSGPMVRGAVELTPRGLIVLGPDHPTTGGYPVVAVVRPSSQDRFFARPAGAVVRFRT